MMPTFGNPPAIVSPFGKLSSYSFAHPAFAVPIGTATGVGFGALSVVRQTTPQIGFPFIFSSPPVICPKGFTNIRT